MEKKQENLLVQLSNSQIEANSKEKELKSYQKTIDELKIGNQKLSAEIDKLKSGFIIY